MVRDRNSHANTESVDDYLNAIFYLGGGERRVGSKEIAERLRVAQASVTNMIQKLASTTGSFVEYET